MEISTAESVGVSSARLARIQPVMEDFVKDNRMPGILTLLQRRGKVVHLGKFGQNDISAGKPMNDDTIFRIYSMTKPIVSVAVLMLLEEGRFSLGEPLSNFVPAFKNTKVYAGWGDSGFKYVEQDTPITLYHLLTHTAGLGYGLFADSPIEDMFRQKVFPFFQRDRPLKEVVERIAEIPLICQPGARWSYSMATDVLGYVVEVVSGMPLDDFLKANIFRPLGMSDTDFYVPAEKINRLAPLYASKALYDPYRLPESEALLIADVSVPTLSPSGGSGLTSTLADYLKFCDCLMNNGAFSGGRLLSRKTVTWMTANHLPESLLPMKMFGAALGTGFGLGVRVMMDIGMSQALTSVGEYGWAGAAKTFFWIDPAEAFIGLFMTQYLPVNDYPPIEIFRNLAYQAILD